MAHPTIEAHTRSITGKKVKTLRRNGLLPANVYGHNVPSQSLQINANDFLRLQRHLSVSSLIGLKVDGGAERPVVIHRIQRDFQTGRSNHIEFFQVNMNERLTASIPLVLTGLSDAVRKNEGVVLVQSLDSLEVICLPGDLPRSIEVPVDKLLDSGDAVFVRDLAIDRSKIEVRSGEDEMIVSLNASQRQPEEEAAVAAEAVETESPGREGQGES